MVSGKTLPNGALKRWSIKGSEILKKLFLALPLLMFPSVVLPENSGFADCHAMSTNYIRLMCYDKKTGYIKPKADKPEEQEGTAATTPATPNPRPQGNQWRYTDENSALDNRKDVWLNVTSNNKEGNTIGSPARAKLWVRCMENRTNLLIGFERYTTDNQNVKFRLDDGSVQTQWMETMRGGDCIGIWSGSRAIPFIRSMFDKEKMVIAYNTYTGPVEFTFDISGLRKRIDPLASACNWKP